MQEQNETSVQTNNKSKRRKPFLNKTIFKMKRIEFVYYVKNPLAGI